MPNDLGFTQEQFFEIKQAARLELARRYAAEKDVLNWGRVLFPEKFSLSFCQELHGYLVSIRGEAFTNTEAPRNHAKTTIECFLIPIFQALEEPETFQHYLNVQATHSKALAINSTIRQEFETNELIRRLYDFEQGDRWSEQQFVMKIGRVAPKSDRFKHEVIFTAIGAGQSIRGINYRNRRPDYIIVDDLYDEEDINNLESTEKKNSWFWSSLYPARAKSRRCSLHLQGTAINGADLMEKLKEQERWKSKTFKAVKDWDSKEVLWPELNTFESLEEDRKDMGSVIFFRELQNERRDEATSIVKRSWLNAWEYDPVELERRLNKEQPEILMVDTLLGNDPSNGKNEENDFTGTALVLKTRWKDGTGNDYWIEGLWNEKLSLNGRVNQLQEISNGRPKNRRLSRVRIEAIAGFNDYADEVIRRTNLPVQRISWVKDKISNLESKSHYFENGKVHLNKNIDPKVKDMIIYQLTTNYPKHDDVRDAVLLCLDDSAVGAGVIVL